MPGSRSHYTWLYTLALRVRGWSLELVGITQHVLVWKKQRLWAMQAHATFIVREGEPIKFHIVPAQVVGNITFPPPWPLHEQHPVGN